MNALANMTLHCSITVNVGVSNQQWSELQRSADVSDRQNIL